MPGGLSVQNASGVIQIDETYSNFILYSSGSIYAGSISDGGILYLPLPYTECLVAVGVSGIWVMLEDNAALGSNAVRFIGGAAYVPYRVYVRATALSPSATNYGFRVWNGSGQLVFDSGLPFMVVKHTATIYGSSLPAYPGTGYTVWHNVSNPYVVLNGSASPLEAGGLSVLRSYGVLVQNGYVDVRRFTYRTIGGSGASMGTSNFKLVVLQS